MKKLLCTLALLSSAAFGQYTQSLVVGTTQVATNGSVPANNGDCTEKIGPFHNYPGTVTNSRMIYRDNCGLDIEFQVGTPGNIMVVWFEGVGGTGPCASDPWILPLSSVTGGGVYIYFSKSTSQKTAIVTFYDANGIVIPSTDSRNSDTGICVFTALGGSPNTNGVSIGEAGSSTAFDLGFYQQYSTFSLASHIPVTAPVSIANCVVIYNLDNNLNDSCSGGGSGTYPLTDASASYVSTGALQRLIASSVSNCPTPYAGATMPTGLAYMSMRVGVSNCITAADSVSENPVTSAVTYLWSQTAGTSVSLSSTTAASPTLTPPSFGPYGFQVVLTSNLGDASIGTLPIGAVSMDSNGAVIYESADTTKIMDPQQAFGRIPATIVDSNNLYAVQQQLMRSNDPTVYDKTWATPRTGTISYIYSGVGFGGVAGTTLSAAITNGTSLTVQVADATPLDLTGLPGTPVWILVGTNYQNVEAMRICSTTGTTGPQTLTACAQMGRGISGNDGNGQGGAAAVVPAQGWPMGTGVGQFRINGSGTQFHSDVAGPACPAGLPGPMGTLQSVAGTVHFTDTTHLTGIGTAFDVGMTNYSIWLSGTYNTGTPFTYWAQITNVSGQTLTLFTAAPSNVDTGVNFAYKLTKPFFFMLQAHWTDGHPFNSLFQHVGCESETVMYAQLSHDTPAINQTAMSGAIGYSYKLGLGAYSPNGTMTPDFYGSMCLVGERFYHRSGFQVGLDLVNSMCPYITRDPEYADGTPPGGVQWLTKGGPVYGVMTCIVTGDCPNLIGDSAGNKWKDVDAFAVDGSIGTYDCNDYDLRTNGAATIPLTIASIWDPSLAATLTAALKLVRDGDKICVRPAGGPYSGSEVNSFFNSFNWGPGNIQNNNPLTLVDVSTPSAAVTGTGFSNWSGQYTATHPSGTTIAASISIGSQTVTPASMTGIVSGYLMSIDTGGNQENVTINAITGSTFTAVFTKTHTGPGIVVAGLPSTATNFYGIDTITARFTTGSSAATILSGSLTPQATGAWDGVSPTTLIWYDGTNTYRMYYSFSGPNIALGAVYTGLSGDYTVTSIGGGNVVSGGQIIGGHGSIWTDNNDTPTSNEALREEWQGTATDSTHATLFRPWSHAGGSTYRISYYNTQTTQQQPFFFGYKTIQMRLAQYSSDAGVASDYATLLRQTSTWGDTYGWNKTNGQQTYYSTVSKLADLLNTATPAGSFLSIVTYQGLGTLGLDPYAVTIGRVNNAEFGNLMVQLHAKNPTAGNKTDVDNFYCATWGCDGILPANYNKGDLAIYKWPGFYYGIGEILTSWPAVRNSLTSSPGALGGGRSLVR